MTIGINYLNMPALGGGNLIYWAAGQKLQTDLRGQKKSNIDGNAHFEEFETVTLCQKA